MALSTTMRRVTITITPEMEQALDRAKREVYYKTSQNAMIRDLIVRGISALEADTAADGAGAQCPDSAGHLPEDPAM